MTFNEAGIFHSNGESIQFLRDHRNRITQVIDPAGNSITYEYDLAGDLIRVTNQISISTGFEYLNDPGYYLDRAFDSLDDPNPVLKAIYEENEQTGQFEFKGVIDALGIRIDQRDFDTDNNTGIIRYGNGNQTTLFYDDRGKILEERDPLGNSTFFEYNDPDNPDLETRIIDRDGNIIDRTYDDRGNVLTIAELGPQNGPLPQPIVTTFTYDVNNNVTSITNALGLSTFFAYDSRDNLIRITNALSDQASFTYDAQGRRETYTDFNGNTTLFVYDDGCPCGSQHQIHFADE